MSSTPQGSDSSTFKYYRDSANGSFADHSRVDTSSGDEVSTTTVGQPHYLSSHTDYQPSMASPQSPGYESNEYSEQITAWQPRTKETSYSIGSESGGSVCGTCAQRFRRRADLERHERTIHVNKASRPYKCEVLGCPAKVNSWAKLDGLQAHNEAWHGDEIALLSNTKDEELHYPEAPNYSSSAQYITSTGVLPGFAATQGPSDLISRLAQTSLEKGSNFGYSYEPSFTGRDISTHVSSKDPSTSREESNPHYKVHRAWEFKRGRVFKTLWSEPMGIDRNPGAESDADVEEGRGKSGIKSFVKVRRFVIVNPMEGHCICLPILTYAGQGVKKNGVHAQHHAPMFNKDGKVVYAKGERESGLRRAPIKFEPDGLRHRLDGISRLNYAKTYTVEYNVKVWFIGKIAKDSEWQFVTDFNDMHPPLEVSGRPADGSGSKSVGSSNTYPGVLYDDDAPTSSQNFSTPSSRQQYHPQYQPQYQSSPTQTSEQASNAIIDGEGDNYSEEDLYSAV